MVKFPKYPFIWNYEDMYNNVLYENRVINLIDIECDNSLQNLIKIFPNSLITEQKQKISITDAKNINFHSWYLSQYKLFESDDKSILIESDSQIKFKRELFGFIFDPDDVFDKNFTILNSKKYSPIYIAKSISNLKINMIPKVYLHSHNINGIFRFSPNENCKIKFNNEKGIKKFYTILDDLICVCICEFI